MSTQNKSHKSLLKTEQLKERINNMQRTKGISFYNNHPHSSSKFFSIDSHQMLTQPSQFTKFQSSKSLIRNKSRSSSSSHSLLKNAKQIKNQTFLVKKSQNSNDFLLTIKKNNNSSHTTKSNSKQQVIKIMERLRVNNKLKINESTKYKLKDNFTQRMLKQKKQNIVSTSRIDLNQIINDKNSEFSMNLQANTLINQKQKNLKSLQNTLRTKQIQLESKEESLKEKEKVMQSLSRVQIEKDRVKQLELIHKQKQVKQKQKHLILEQQKIVKLQQQKRVQIEQQQGRIQMQKQRLAKLQSQRKKMQNQNISFAQNRDSYERPKQNYQDKKYNEKRGNQQERSKLPYKQKQTNKVDKNRFYSMQSSSGVDLDDIQQIDIGNQKPANKIYQQERYQVNINGQNLNQTPNFSFRKGDARQQNQNQNNVSQKNKLTKQYQRLSVEVQKVTSIGEVPYYCSTSLKKSKYSWQLACLLLYKYSYDKFLQMQDLYRLLVQAKLTETQFLDTKIQQNLAIKGNLIKIRKSVQKKSKGQLPQNVSNFLNLQKKLTSKEKEQFIILIYKQVYTMCDQYINDRKPQNKEIQSCYLRIVNSILIIEQIQFKQKYQQQVIAEISQVKESETFNKLTLYYKKVKELAKKRCK